MPLSGLQGKRALVTGAASGIGHAVVEKLKKEQVEVFSTDIHDAHGVIVADLTDADDVEKLAGKVGAIDFLINVAGGPIAPTRTDTLPALPKSMPFEDISEQQWAAVIAANLTTAFLVCREFAPKMKARRFGRIVNFASIAARRGSSRVGVHYAAAKGGIIGLTKTLALELGPHNVTVNAIAPGFIKTPRIAEASWGHDSAAAEQAFISSLPLRRAGKPDDIAGVVAMLCSDAGGYVSGATIDVNGGWYFGP
ncbi:MAG TPA: SDR family NAD(P)-dependent oxidoreductase [Burkholderiales bacterium]|jgi:3-oxoacyl-[acyl-carrier protein] reductase|nr:SDR family NAD(P)-dependent oxidoreductase [Burkholderiales bacterium]